MTYKIKQVIWTITGAVYFPIYVFSWALLKVTRIVLAIAYIGMLEGRKGKDIIKNIFK